MSPKTRVDSRENPTSPPKLSRFQAAFRKAIQVRKRFLKRRLSTEEFQKLKVAVRKQLTPPASRPRSQASSPPPDPLARLPSPLPLPSSPLSEQRADVNDQIASLQFKIEVLQQNIFFLRRELSSFTMDTDPFMKIVNYAAADITAYGSFVLSDGRSPTQKFLRELAEVKGQHLFVTSIGTTHTVGPDHIGHPYTVVVPCDHLDETPHLCPHQYVPCAQNFGPSKCCPVSRSLF